MNKSIIAKTVGALVILVAGFYIGSLLYYQTPQDNFAGWHHSLEEGKQDAKARQVPMLVKVGNQW